MSPMEKMPLWRDANRLLLLVEQAVRHFPRYHKYTLGSDLRRQVMRLCRLIVRACNTPEQRLRYVQQLVDSVDDFKVQIQLAKELKVFRRFTEFQAIAELAVSLGKQSGGWKRRLQGGVA
jgi:hypothetical protein